MRIYIVHLFKSLQPTTPAGCNCPVLTVDQSRKRETSMETAREIVLMNNNNVREGYRSVGRGVNMYLEAERITGSPDIDDHGHVKPTQPAGAWPNVHTYNYHGQSRRTGIEETTGKERSLRRTKMDEPMLFTDNREKLSREPRRDIRVQR